MDQSLVPWMILVPKVSVKEIYQLSPQEQTSLLTAINLCSEWMMSYFDIEKMNVAALGNVVSQLHVHVVGRSSHDFCWPGVVWGQAERQPYTQEVISDIAQALKKHLSGLMLNRVER